MIHVHVDFGIEYIDDWFSKKKGQEKGHGREKKNKKAIKSVLWRARFSL